MRNKVNYILEKYMNPKDYKLDMCASEILSLFGVRKSVVCGNCDGWGYTVDENGRRKDHCKECE
jgi:hypothetical protein